jgi:hypothetical protein
MMVLQACTTTPIKQFLFLMSNLSIFFFYVSCFYILFKKSLPTPSSQKCSLFSLESIIGLHFTFKSDVKCKLDTDLHTWIYTYLRFCFLWLLLPLVKPCLKILCVLTLSRESPHSYYSVLFCFISSYCC